MLLFAVLVVLVTLFGTTAIFFGLFGDNNADVSAIPRDIDGGVWDATWWAINYVIRLPAFEGMYGASGPILAYAMVLSILGLAVFGVLVSLINNAMRTRIERLSLGDTPVKERGHLVVLGWNNKVISVLRQLARLQPGARVVILATEEVREMSEALRVAGIPREPITIILRTGIPSNRDELDRIAVQHASGVIVLSAGTDDSDAIKTLVLLATIDDWPGEPPTLTAEIVQEQNFDLAEIGARNRLHVVSSSRVTSRFVVQTIRNPGLGRIYDELMSTDGNSIHVQDVAACTDETLGDIAYGFAEAVPIGITWEQKNGEQIQHKVGLNPEPDYDVARDEHLVLIARDVPTTFRAPGSRYTSGVFVARESTANTPRKILLIGWTESLYDILKELNAHATAGTRVTVLAELDEESARVTMLEELGADLDHLELERRQGDATSGAAYEGLDPGSFDSLAVLADESMDDGDADTRSLRILLRIQEVAPLASTQTHIVVELLDGDNRDLFTSLGVRDVIVSSEVISAQLAQISRQKVLGSIYRELLSAGGVEISLRPAREYVAHGATCAFEDLIYATQQNSEIALGLCLDGSDVLLNPPREARWQLGDRDEIVVLAEQVYR